MKTFILFGSSRKDKRYMVKTQNKTVHFGSPIHENYTIHNDDLRKFRYIQRHRKNEDWSEDGIFTAGFWSYWLLWNKPTLKQSIKDIEKNFNIKIINSIV